jgi:DNA-binding LacI/PurR family transcriptional regulator
LTDIHLAHQFRPALTTVRFPTPRIAAQTIGLTLEMVEGGTPARSVYTVGEPELVVRESTGPAPVARRNSAA